MDDLLSLPSEDPLLVDDPPNNLTLEGVGSELAELSLKVDAESRSPLPALARNDGFRSELVEPPLSDRRPYSPNFLGGGMRERAGDARLLLAFELSDSPPSDFFRGEGGASDSGSRLYLGKPLRWAGRGGRGSELGGSVLLFSEAADPAPPAASCIRCCWEARPCFSSSSISLRPPDWGRSESKTLPPPPLPLPPPLTPANSGLGIFPFLCAVTGLVNPGKQQRPR